MNELILNYQRGVQNVGIEGWGKLDAQWGNVYESAL